MKKIIFVILFAFVLPNYIYYVNAQTSSNTRITQTSTDAPVNFRLFQTNNRWTFLKLDTRNGVITHVQYSVDSDAQSMEYSLNPNPLVTKEKEKPGRFFLYPTENTYNFLLLDQIDGKVWQVQWNIDENKRGMWRIY